MTDNSRERALSGLEKLREEYGDHAAKLSEVNEAETRLLLIDEILGLLGWNRNEFKPESPTSHGYIDYLLTADGIPRLIVEAKRLGYTFSSPAHQMKKTTYPLSYLKRAYGVAFAEVLDQATRYSYEEGVPYAVITNGAEWALVQLIKSPGQADVNELQGFYFGKAFSDSFNFDLFWELLSKPSVISGSLEENLAQLNLREVDFSIIPRTQLGSIRWQEAERSRFLNDFYDLFFDEITDAGRRNMLERCFITDAHLNHYEGELRRMLKDTAPRYIPGASDISPAERENIFTESGDQKGRVTLVTGSVGCGKSTFVTKVLVEARQERNLICLVVDLIDEVTGEQNEIVSTLWKYLYAEWRQAEPEAIHYPSLQKIFGREITDLKNGPHARLFAEDEREFARHEAGLLDSLLKDPEQYFPKCWQYYRQKRKGIAVFFDNVDRASKEYQQQVYAFANKLARKTGATVVITMREVTFSAVKWGAS